VALWLCAGPGFAQAPAGGATGPLAYPEPDSSAAWRSLAASYVRKAVRDQKLDKDPVLNARIDAVMAAVGAAVAGIDPRFTGATASWKAILIEGFGRGAAAFPGETILVDSAFVRNLSLSDDELALILSHEAAHVVARHASKKLSFMADFLGKEKVPNARTALLEFLAKDSYATQFQPKARQQEREADTVGAAIFFASGYDLQRALTLFDKLADMETRGNGRSGDAGQASDTHDSAATRKQIVAAVIADLQARQAPGEQR
jgi:predicted Zn-dependent protease